MGILNKILDHLDDRPPYLLLVAGDQFSNAAMLDISKKSLEELTTVL